MKYLFSCYLPFGIGIILVLTIVSIVTSLCECTNLDYMGTINIIIWSVNSAVILGLVVIIKVNSTAEKNERF